MNIVFMSILFFPFMHSYRTTDSHLCIGNTSEVH